MTLDTIRYIPCLRWKQGEYLAVEQLSSFARESIIPLIEVAEIGFDFETQTESKSIDDHLQLFAKRVYEKWGMDECFVDFRLIEATQRMADGGHPITYVFEDLRSKGVLVIPVTVLNPGVEWMEAIQHVVDQDGRGFCLRIDLETAAKPNLTEAINNLLRTYHRSVEQCDLILDETAPNFEPLDGFLRFLEQIIIKLPYLRDWRSFGLIGTSLPPSLSVLGTGVAKIPRNEWRAYQALQRRLKTLGIRIPIFGDYGVNHPEVLKVDPRHMRTTANIRYTIDDRWLIARGRSLKDYGYGQHKDLSQEIIDSGHFKGPDYSWGDQYIWNCAKGKATAGNLTTWRRVGTSHHLEVVARDVANSASS